MLQTEDYGTLLKDKYSSFPGISCVTKAKDKYSSSLFLSNPYFGCKILTEKQKKAQETILNSKNPQEVAQAQKTLDEISTYITSLFYVNDGLMEDLDYEYIYERLINLIQPDDIKKIAESVDLKNVYSSKLCYLLSQKIEDETLKEQFLNKRTKFGVPVKERIWENRYNSEVSKLFDVEEIKGASSPIYKMSFREIMKRLKDLFDDKHIPELKNFLFNMRTKVVMEGYGSRFYSEEYHLNKLFNAKIEGDKQKQEEFGSLIKRIISDNTTSIFEGVSLLKDFEECMSASTIEECSEIISSKA